MYNRYDGNTGRFVRIPEPEPPARRQQPALRNPPPPPERRPTYNPPPERSRAKYGPPPARGGGLDSLFPENISGLLGKLVPGALREGLELEDLLLMLILYLMYRESGDKEPCSSSEPGSWNMASSGAERLGFVELMRYMRVSPS